jgi:hypothetical protein
MPNRTNSTPVPPEFEPYIRQVTSTTHNSVQVRLDDRADATFMVEMSDGCEFILPFAALEHMTNQQIERVLGQNRRRQTQEAADAYYAWYENLTAQRVRDQLSPMPTWNPGRNMQEFLRSMESFPAPTPARPAEQSGPPVPSTQPEQLTVRPLPHRSEYNTDASFISHRQYAGSQNSWTERARIFASLLELNGISGARDLPREYFSRPLQGMFKQMEDDALAQQTRFQQTQRELDLVRRQLGEARAETVMAKTEAQTLTTLRDAAIAWRDSDKPSVEKLKLFKQMMESVDALTAPAPEPAQEVQPAPELVEF